MSTEITINGTVYVPKSETARNVEGAPYVLVRGRDSGVQVGWLMSREGQEVALSQARRIWYWAGAASISELAQRGTSKPQDCKFPAPVGQVTILDAIEVLDVTEAARVSIASVPVWSA